jgi:hypothetical protein
MGAIINLQDRKLLQIKQFLVREMRRDAVYWHEWQDDPPDPGEINRWLAEAEQDVEAVLADMVDAYGRLPRDVEEAAKWFDTDAPPV